MALAGKGTCAGEIVQMAAEAQTFTQTCDRRAWVKALVQHKTLRQ
jgi:hypothetical protein